MAWVAAATRLAAQDSLPPPLEFLGFAAGAPLVEVARQAAHLGARQLKCDRARKDRSVLECRATLVDSISGRPLSLWLSAIDSASAIVTLSGPVAADQLQNWKLDLEDRYGVVDARVQGPQWMLQWVRHGRMLRLTWREEQGQKVASVSLTDGWILDAWGRKRAGKGGP
jgi:hypothetical protein